MRELRSVAPSLRSEVYTDSCRKSCLDGRCSRAADGLRRVNAELMTTRSLRAADLQDAVRRNLNHADQAPPAGDLVTRDRTWAVRKAITLRLIRPGIGKRHGHRRMSRSHP